jgi:hypothetical protein
MDYNSFTVEELKLECKKKGITGYSKLRKEEIINLVISHDNLPENTFYIDPKTWGENVIQCMNKRKKWKYLMGEKKGDYYYPDRIIKEGKWNLFWKPTPFSYISPSVKIPIYYLPKADNSIIQVINHFPNLQAIGEKIELANFINNHREEFKNIFPKTYIIKNISDRPIYKKILKSKNKYWIVKPDKEYGGIGVTFFDDPKKAVNFIDTNITKGLTLEDYRKGNIKNIKKEGWIIQKYVENPLLYKGRKFDIRVHILIRDSGEIYFCKYGYIRISSVPYKLEATGSDKSKALIHVTNQALQTTFEDFGTQEEGNTLLLEDFMKYLQEIFGKKEGKNLYNKLINDWKSISKFLLEKTWKEISKKSKEIPNRRYYELIGFDYMVDENFNTWLIEANTNPALNDKTSWGLEISPKILDETLHICVDSIFNKNYKEKLEWFELI